jgi:hypothetical protein
MLRNGRPRFANIKPYAEPGSSLNDTIRFAREQIGGAFFWEEVARAQSLGALAAHLAMKDRGTSSTF